MRWTPRTMRFAVVGCLVIPAAVILLAGSLRAQVRPPNPMGGQMPPPFPQPPVPQPPIMKPPQMQQPPMQPPKMQQIPKGSPTLQWTCGKCGKVIGTGAGPPGTCPFCGVKIINGFGPAQKTGPNPPGNPGGNSPPNQGFKPPQQQKPVFIPPPKAPPMPPPDPFFNVNAQAPPEGWPQDVAEEGRPSRAGLIFVIVMAGILFMGAVAAGIGCGVYFFVIKPAAVPKRRRRVGRGDDE